MYVCVYVYMYIYIYIYTYVLIHSVLPSRKMLVSYSGVYFP